MMLNVLHSVLLFRLQLEWLWVWHPPDGAAVWCTETEHDPQGAQVSTRRVEYASVYTSISCTVNVSYVVERVT